MKPAVTHTAEHTVAPTTAKPTAKHTVEPTVVLKTNHETYCYLSPGGPFSRAQRPGPPHPPRRPSSCTDCGDPGKGSASTTHVYSVHLDM